MQTSRRYILYIPLLLLFLLISYCGCVKIAPTVVELDDKYIVKGNSKVYYTDNIPQKDIDALIDYFDSIEFFTSDEYMKLDKSDADEFFIYIYVSKYVINSKAQLAFYQDLANSISIELDPSLITIYLCNNKFETVKTIESKRRMSDADYYSRDMQEWFN